MAKILIGRKLTQSTDSVTAKQGDAGAAGWLVKDLNKLVPEEFDYVDLSYTGALLTGVVYKQGGLGGTTVATLSLTYSGIRLLSVLRT